MTNIFDWNGINTISTKKLNIERLEQMGVRSDWRPPDLSALPSWEGAKRIGIDTETHDPQLKQLGCGVRRGGRMVGISFAIEDGPKHYLPYAHEAGDNLPRDAVLGYVRENAKKFTGYLCGANIPYDLDYLWSSDITFPQVRGYKDIMVADPLINELHDFYSLEAISQRWGFPGKNEEMLRAAAAAWKLDPKKDMWRMPARYVGPYAENDAYLPLVVLRKQERRIVEDELEKVYALESRLIPVLLKMRRRGVRIDLKRLDRVEEWATAAERGFLERIRHETGVTIPLGDVNAASSLGPALRAAGISLGTVTAAGKDSVTNAALEAVDHPVARAMVLARKVNKMRTSFVASTREHLIGDRIHCTFNQLRKTNDEQDEGTSSGAKYGRLSSSLPNLQQQMGNGSNLDGLPLGCIWRGIFVPDEGVWASLDLKQQEPKWSFDFSARIKLLNKHTGQLEHLPGALETCKMLNDNPLMDTYQPLVQQTGRKRGECKILWLARAYGQGDGTLCEALGLPTRMKAWKVGSREKAVYIDTSEEEAEARKRGCIIYKGAGPDGQKIIDSFDGTLPFLKRAARLAQERASERGYILTVSGRRCHFPSDNNGGWNWTEKAFNRAIQGSAADQTKEIVVAADDAGWPLQLQVHDEITASLADRAKAMELGELMKGVVPMLVPTMVDVETGPSWGESMKHEVIVDGSKKEIPFVWNLG